MSFHVAIYFIVQATFQLGTLSGKLLRIQGNILITCGTCRYGNKAGHPRRTAKLTSARTDASDTSRFLTGADLFHLDTYAECFSQYLDQLAEVHALIGNVIEDSLIAVSLVLYISDFHVQIEI